MEWAQGEKFRSYLSRDIYVQDLGLCAAECAGAAHTRRHGAANGLSCRRQVRPHPADPSHFTRRAVAAVAKRWSWLSQLRMLRSAAAVAARWQLIGHCRCTGLLPRIICEGPVMLTGALAILVARWWWPCWLAADMCKAHLCPSRDAGSDESGAHRLLACACGIRVHVPRERPRQSAPRSFRSSLRRHSSQAQAHAFAEAVRPSVLPHRLLRCARVPQSHLCLSLRADPRLGRCSPTPRWQIRLPSTASGCEPTDGGRLGSHTARRS